VEGDLLFRILFLVLWAILAVIRLGYGRKGKKKEGEEEGKRRWGDMTKFEKGALIVISADILFYIIFSVCYVLGLPWIMWFQVPLPELMRWIGVGITSTGLPLLLWVHHTLGRHWSRTLEIKEEHRLCMDGPYSRVRHPMYTVFFIFMLGMSLVSANVLILFLSIIFVVFMYTFLIPSEEKMMLEYFGEEYQKYMQWTGRIFPRILHKTEEKPASKSQEVK
jgi:protein-S-isoprenylcysteine O-methyltransferase Ste14